MKKIMFWGCGVLLCGGLLGGETGAAPPAPPAEAPAEKPPEKAPGAQGVNVVNTKHLSIDIYGSLRADGAYNSHRVFPGNFVYWATAQRNNISDDEFTLTANQTRLGLNLKGPAAPGMKTSGVLEMDFYGGGGETAPNPRLRRAFGAVCWTDLDLAVSGGQEWELMSQLNAPTLDICLLGCAGNLGLRRPQLRITKGFYYAPEVRYEIGLALTRNIGEANTAVPGLTLDTGRDAGFPTAQGRAALQFPGWVRDGPPILVGFSGHYGQEEWDRDADNHHAKVRTWSVNCEVQLPLFKGLTLTGEAFIGSNLDTYMAGIAQGVNPTSWEDIQSQGGWAALKYRPFKPLEISAGAGVDDPKNGDLNTGMRSRNAAAFLNVLYQINDYVQVGVEGSRWQTDYLHTDKTPLTRGNFAFIFSF